MNADFARAWRYLHKYALGLIVVLELFILLQGSESVVLMREFMRKLFRSDVNTVLVVFSVLLVSLLGSAIIELLHSLVTSITSKLISLQSIRQFIASSSGRRAWVNLFTSLLQPVPILLQEMISSNKALIREYLYVISIGNISKDRGPQVTNEEKAYFERVIALISQPHSPDVFWQLSYGNHLTQDRREIDAAQTEVLLAFGYTVACLLGLAVLFVLNDHLKPFASTSIIGLLFVAIAGTANYAISARKKQVTYMLSLCIQFFAWGEQSQIEDRDAV